MIPLRDNIPSQRTSFVNYTIIAIAAGVFLLELSQPPQAQQRMIESYAMIPARITDPGQKVEVQEQVVRHGREEIIERPAADPPFHPWLTLITSMFLHGGWMHFLGNMWFLFIFGDNVEDRFGHFGFLLFYLATGILATLAHVAVGPESTVPTIGASGAIAAVMGAYFVLYPHARVLTLIPVFFLLFVSLPAPVFLGVWFLIQFLQGTMQFGMVESGGVAFWAHIGGFVVGMAGAWILARTHILYPPVNERRPNSDHATAYRYRRRRDDHGW